MSWIENILLFQYGLKFKRRQNVTAPLHKKAASVQGGFIPCWDSSLSLLILEFHPKTFSHTIDKVEVGSDLTNIQYLIITAAVFS